MRLPFMLRRTHNRILEEETRMRQQDARFYQRAIRELQQTQQRPQRPGVVIDPAKGFEPAAPGMEGVG